MRKQIFCFLLALLTFTISMVITYEYRVYQFRRQSIIAQEEGLYGKLLRMRLCIDRYAVDKGELPQSLYDLVQEGYLREIPLDPVTQMHTWKIVAGTNPHSLKGRQGIVDVHSISSAISSEGTRYSEW